MNDPDADLNLTRGKTNSSKTNEVFRSVPEVFPMGTVRNTSVPGAVRDSSEQFGRPSRKRHREAAEIPTSSEPQSGFVVYGTVP